MKTYKFIVFCALLMCLLDYVDYVFACVILQRANKIAFNVCQQKPSNLCHWHAA